LWCRDKNAVTAPLKSVVHRDARKRYASYPRPVRAPKSEARATMTRICVAGQMRIFHHAVSEIVHAVTTRI